MRVLVQRVNHASVKINGVINGSIDKGYMLLVGFKQDDNEEIIDKMINKILYLRIFEDENGKMNKSLLDVNGSILSISQFTLYGNCKEGRRPSFTDACKPEKATVLYDLFNKKLENIGINVGTGIFGSDMKVLLENDGPCTFMLDSAELKME